MGESEQAPRDLHASSEGFVVEPALSMHCCIRATALPSPNLVLTLRAFLCSDLSQPRFVCAADADQVNVEWISLFHRPVDGHILRCRPEGEVEGKRPWARGRAQPAAEGLQTTPTLGILGRLPA